MKNKKIILILIVVATFLCTSHAEDSVIISGNFLKVKCSCVCQGICLEASSISDPGNLLTRDIAIYDGKKMCQEQCARSCGGYTSCASQNDADCGTCCQSFCSDSAKGYGGDFKAPCLESCSSTCSYRGLVDGIVTIIYEVAGILGGLLIVINGIRMLTAQDPGDRNAAKNGIMYVIIALIIIILAATLVGLLLKPGQSPSSPSGSGSCRGTSTTPTPSCYGCGGAGDCTSDKCHGTSGCWFDHEDDMCFACVGFVRECGDYISDSECTANPCNVPGGCKYVIGENFGVCDRR